MMTGSLPRFLICCAVLCLIGSRAAGQWTTPIQITSGPQDDIHPAFAAVGRNMYSGSTEWLAFVRTDGSGSRICVKKTAPGSVWDDSVFSITNDPSWNDYPAIAQIYNRGMVVWQRDSVHSDIFYSYNNGGGWSPPAPLTTDGAGNRSPSLAVYDTTFIAVWEKAGRIVYSKLLGGSWTPPTFVTAEGDTLNTSPGVDITYVYPELIVVVAWEKRKTPDTTCTIMYSAVRSSGISAPDTIAWTGDNRRAMPMKLSGYGVYFTYESNRAGRWEIYSAEGFFIADSLQWSNRSHNMSQNTSVDNTHASLSFVPLITEPAGQAFWNASAAGTWRVVSGASDSIAAADNYGRSQFLTPAPGTTDRNPDISAGMFVNGDWRVWTVWENNVNGHWNLYGSHIDIVLGVDEYSSLPSTVRLYQNFPNPFNPATTFSFDIPHSAFVILKVYDLLGREVATLVHESKQAGHYSATWNAADQASGVYFARCVAVGAGEVKYSKVQKLLLMK